MISLVKSPKNKRKTRGKLIKIKSSQLGSMEKACNPSHWGRALSVCRERSSMPARAPHKDPGSKSQTRRKRHLHSKGNKSEETTYPREENILNYTFDTGPTSKTHKELLTLSSYRQKPGVLFSNKALT